MSSRRCIPALAGQSRRRRPDLARLLPGLLPGQQRRLDRRDAATPAPGGAPIIDSLKQSHVHYLIAAYRAIGHLQAHLDPLSGPPAPTPKLELGQFQLGEADLDTAFDVGTYLGGGQMKLRDLIASLKKTYCGHVGVEYVHIQDQDCRLWLQERIESTRMQPAFNAAAEGADPQAGPQGRALREVPPHEVCRPEALLARGRRDDHRGPGRRHRPLPGRRASRRS